jgi:hypothetical protein
MLCLKGEFFKETPAIRIEIDFDRCTALVNGISIKLLPLADLSRPEVRVTDEFDNDLKALNNEFKDTLEGCLKPFQECLQKKHPKLKIVENKMPKVQTEILLKSFDKNLSKDNLTEWIDYYHESLDNFKKFLKKVFKIRTNKQ